MEYGLKDIKIIRKRLGLTQSELARKANVSQSLIAKIESNRIDPTFSKAKQIFETLNNLQQKHSLKAKDVMKTDIISISSNKSVSEAVKKMGGKNISQLPVYDDRLVGIISEGSVMDSIREGKDINSIKVKEVMEDAPPIISEDADIGLVTSLLKHSPLVIVSKHGKMKGLITKADILEKFYNQ